MQQVINGAATPADVRQQRNIKAKSAAEKGSETERVDPSSADWTTWGTQHGLLRVRDPREGGQAL